MVGCEIISLLVLALVLHCSHFIRAFSTLLTKPNMSNFSSHLSDITKLLSASNFALWKLEFNQLMMLKGLGQFLADGATRPTSGSQKQTEFDALQGEANLVLLYSLSAEVKTFALNEGWLEAGLTPFTLYEKLTKKYGQVTYQQKLQTLGKFQQLKLGKLGLPHFISEIRRLRGELASMSVTLTPLDLKSKLLAELPNSMSEQAFFYQSEEHQNDTFDSVAEHFAGLPAAVTAEPKSVPKTSTALHASSSASKPLCPICDRYHRGKCFGPTGSPERAANEAAYFKKRAEGQQPSSVGSTGAGNGKSSLLYMSLSATINTNSKITSWIADSGATDHMTHQRYAFKSRARKRIRVANDKLIWSLGTADIGPIRDALVVPDLSHNLLSMSKMADQYGQVVFTGEECYICDVHGNVLATGVREGNLFTFTQDILMALPSPDVATGSSAASCLVAETENDQTRATILWHERFGHLGFTGLGQIVSKAAVDGMDPRVSVTSAKALAGKHCDACVLGKSHRMPIFKHKHERAQYPFELMHVDLQGQFPATRNNNVYVMNLLDDYSRNVFPYFMERKSEAPQWIREFVLEHTTPTVKVNGIAWGCSMERLRSDNGGEFKSKDMSSFCSAMGIKQEFSESYTPEQNGAVERINRTLVEMTRCLLQHSRLDDCFWAHAYATAAYIRNRSLTAGGDPTRTPFELLNGFKPDVREMRVFGCKCHCFIHVKKRENKKLDRTTFPGYFLGYADNGYRVLKIPSVSGKAVNKWEIVVTREVVSWEEDKFISERIPSDFAPHLELLSRTEECVSDEQVGCGTGASNDGWISARTRLSKPNSTSTSSSTTSTSTSSALAAIGCTGSRYDVLAMDDDEDDVEDADAAWGMHTFVADPSLDGFVPVPPSFEEDSCVDFLYDNIDTCALQAEMKASVPIPHSYEAALRSSHVPKWKEAMEAELAAMKEHNTWEDVGPSDLPVDHFVGSKWLYDLKCGADGDILRYKGRVVAQGFSQIEGVDYRETFAPVASRATMRLILSIAAQQDMEIEQMDVCTAFLNAPLPEDEQMIMKAPKGYPSETGYVRLLKSLYGLKQAPREWNIMLDKCIRKMGYKRCRLDRCLYFKRDAQNELSDFILVYVDDLIIGSMSTTDMQSVKAQFNEQFKMKDLGPLKYCLGLLFERDRENRTISISQEKYIQETLEMFDMTDATPVNTVMSSGCKLDRSQCPVTEEDKDAMKDIPYRMAVGRLLYIMCCTRPDIAFAVNSCAKFMGNPGMEHWDAVKRIMRYLKGTATKRLTLGGMINKQSDNSGYSLLNEVNCPCSHDKVLLGYSDADYAGCVDTRRSTTGFIFFFNGPISWNSRRQSTVALSPCEAEYMALAAAASESRWLSQLLHEISPNLCKKVIVFEDNTSTIALGKHGRITPRSKHIDVKHHFLQELVEEGYLTIHYAKTTRMCADLLTKNLGSRILSMHNNTVMG